MRYILLVAFRMDQDITCIPFKHRNRILVDIFHRLKFMNPSLNILGNLSLFFSLAMISSYLFYGI